MPTYTIEVDTQDSTLKFAAGELRRYLARMLRGAKFVRANSSNRPNPGFILAEARNCPGVIAKHKVVEGQDRDQILIVSQGPKLILSGNNPRSVLFAVYDFLERLGARWLHAGPGGETIPKLKTLKLSGWNLEQTASFRYRGVDVEGAFTPRHAIAFIDWMAKKKMNHFVMQLENGTFWYRRMVPALKISEAIKWDREIAAEVKKRGLMLEWYGHGWNYNAIGKRVVGLDKSYKVPARLKPLIAKVNGKRKWHNNYPLETQLCLTNPKARRKVMSYLERYVRRHRDIDILGFWLADGINNQCECKKCSKFRMSELYADYVNEAVERIHRIRPELKLEILAYHTTLEPPERVPLKDPYGSLILMLAPLFRCYRHRLHDMSCATAQKVPSFPVLNKQPRLMNGDFARFFRGWRRHYKGDTYLFDYHMLALTYDFLGGNIPRVASRDIKDLKEEKFDGYVGCQNLRCFWPSGLGMKVISETLWDVGKPYATIREEHLREWFGPAANAAGKAFDAMYAATKGLYPAHGRAPSVRQLQQSQKSLEKVAAELRLACTKRRERPIGRRLSFLADHAEFLADQLTLRMKARADEIDAARNHIREFFLRHAKDAEFLLDAQYHGKEFLSMRPKRIRRLTGQ